MSDPYVEDEPQTYPGESWAGEPIPVTSVNSRQSPEYAACMTWSVPQNTAGQPVQLLQRRVKRYKARLSITALGGATSIVVNSKLDPLQGSSPQGATFIGPAPSNNVLEWESQQPLYAIALGGGPVSITVIDESYAER